MSSERQQMENLLSETKVILTTGLQTEEGLILRGPEDAFQYILDHAPFSPDLAKEGEQ